MRSDNIVWQKLIEHTHLTNEEKTDAYFKIFKTWNSNVMMLQEFDLLTSSSCSISAQNCNILEKGKHILWENRSIAYL